MNDQIEILQFYALALQQQIEQRNFEYGQFPGLPLTVCKPGEVVSQHDGGAGLNCMPLTQLFRYTLQIGFVNVLSATIVSSSSRSRTLFDISTSRVFVSGGI